jgi:hypothetical protein
LAAVTVVKLLTWSVPLIFTSSDMLVKPEPVALPL